MATLTKKDLLKAIEDMPMEKEIKILIKNKNGHDLAFGVFKSCKSKDDWIMLIEK